MAYLKGQEVNIFRAVTDKSGNISYQILAMGATSCDFNLKPNTVDGASKQDKDPDWDNPIFTYCDWTMSHESFIADAAALKTLIGLAVAGEPIDVVWHNASGAMKHGKALITSLEVDAPSDDYAKLTISLDGCGALDDFDGKTVSPGIASSKLRGKTLMVAYNDGTEYKTFCAATSHKLSISVQTADTKTKDDNDLAPKKDVTGYSMTLNTENLINIDTTYGVSADSLLDSSLAGTTLPLKFGYYDASGMDVVEYNSNVEATAEEKGYGAPGQTGLIITANCLCTSYSLNAPNKDNVTMSAEFTAQGKPTFEAA